MAARAWNNTHGIELRRCRACAFVFSAQAGFSYEELFVGSFAGKSRDDLIRAARAQGLHTMVAEIVAKTGLEQGAKVMDFGAGIGLAALTFMQAGYDVVAVEQSRRYVEAYAGLGIQSAPSIGQARQMRESFDLVVMKDVLEHLDDPRAPLAALIESIRRGGHLYIRVPNVLAYRFHWDVDTKSHVNHFAPATLIKLVESFGMKRRSFVGIYDVSSRAGRIYNAIFWRMRAVVPLYHQISLLFSRE